MNTQRPLKVVLKLETQMDGPRNPGTEGKRGNEEAVAWSVHSVRSVGHWELSGLRRPLSSLNVWVLEDNSHVITDFEDRSKRLTQQVSLKRDGFKLQIPFQKKLTSDPPSFHRRIEAQVISLFTHSKRQPSRIRIPQISPSRIRRAERSPMSVMMRIRQKWGCRRVTAGARRSAPANLVPKKSTGTNQVTSPSSYSRSSSLSLAARRC